MASVQGRLMVGAMALMVVGAMVVAGPLNPPGGAIAPTGKTLQEIFDKPSGGDGRIEIPGGTGIVALTQPGSYVLKGDIDVSASPSGLAILIAGSNITVDLNGHRLIGDVTGTNVSAITVLVNPGFSNLVIRNGTVLGGANGVSVNGDTTGLTLEDVSVYGAKGNGIIVSGTSRGCVVRRCRVFDTGSTTTAADGTMFVAGISIGGTGNRVEECTVSRLIYNGSGTGLLRGIVVNGTAGNVVERCVVANGAAATGIGITATGAVYRGNTVGNLSTGYSGGTDGGGNF